MKKRDPKVKNGLLIRRWLHTHFTKILGWGTISPRKVKTVIKMLCLARGYTSKQFRTFNSNAAPYYYPVRWSDLAVKIFVSSNAKLAPTLLAISSTRKASGRSKYQSMKALIFTNEATLVKGIRATAGAIFFATSLFCRLYLFRTCFFCTPQPSLRKRRVL